jgi:hypothetical protein
MTSIDNATPEEWDAIAKKFNGYKTDGQMAREAKRRTKQINKVNEKLDEYNNVNSPVHYNQGQTECIDAIEAMLSVEEYIGYLRGNSTKYRWRFRYKNGIEDLNKAEWYEKRLVKFMEDHNVLGQKNRTIF